jgi:hypothetical protein
VYLYQQLGGGGAGWGAGRGGGTNTKQKGLKYPSREGGETHIEQKEKIPARDRLEGHSYLIQSGWTIFIIYRKRNSAKIHLLCDI